MVFTEFSWSFPSIYDRQQKDLNGGASVDQVELPRCNISVGEGLQVTGALGAAPSNAQYPSSNLLHVAESVSVILKMTISG